MMLPLDGYLVVALEQAVAVPLATRHLADLGARVVKLEHPDGGDLARGYDHVVHGTGAHFVWLNRGKESLAVDLKSPVGLGIVRRLVAKADVFVQNLAPGAAARLGLDAQTLREQHAGLVVVNLTGYGDTGPMAGQKAYDMLIQAEAGLISVTGTPETPVKTGIPTADIAAGMYCVQAVLAALLRRGHTGDGATLDLTMLDATIEWMGYSVYTQLHTGRQPPRTGLGHPSIAPYDGYPTLDGEVLIGVQSDPGWRDLVTQVLDAPELADDPRFRTNVERVRHRSQCDAEVGRRTAGWRSAELVERLTRAGVPAAQVKQLADVVTHPQLRARDRWRLVNTEFTQIEALLPPVTFPDAETPMGDVPALGQHTRDLLAEVGLSDDEVAQVLGCGAAVQSGSFTPTSSWEDAS